MARRTGWRRGTLGPSRNVNRRSRGRRVVAAQATATLTRWEMSGELPRGTPWLEPSRLIKGGTSGGPVVDDNGHLVGWFRGLVRAGESLPVGPSPWPTRRCPAGSGTGWPRPCERGQVARKADRQPLAMPAQRRLTPGNHSGSVPPRATHPPGRHRREAPTVRASFLSAAGRQWSGWFVLVRPRRTIRTIRTIGGWVDGWFVRPPYKGDGRTNHPMPTPTPPEAWRTNRPPSGRPPARLRRPGRGPGSATGACHGPGAANPRRRPSEAPGGASAAPEKA
jgi:hypothetical protein